MKAVIINETGGPEVLEIKDINNPDGDIEIVYRGLGPGEKLHEELLIDGKSEKTSHPLIFKAIEKSLDFNDLKEKLDNLSIHLNKNEMKKTIQNFVTNVQSLERLKLLLVLTVADIRAVGPKIWNGWKASLMRVLYYESERVLGGLAPTQEEIYLAFEIAKTKFNDRFDSMFDSKPSTFPHYDLIKFDDEHYKIQLCLAGFKKEDIISIFLPDTYEVYWNISSKS